MTHRDIRLACLRAAEIPARGLPALPYLANALILLAFLFHSLTLPALLLAAFVHLATRRELHLRETHYRQLQSFAERLADALIPATPAEPIHPTPLTNPATLILRACRRAAATESHQLNRGLQHLATISATAPFFGFLGTCLGILNAFGPVSGEKSAILAATANRISDAIIPTAMALALAVFAYITHHALKTQQEKLTRQMDTLSLSLSNALTRES